MSDEQGIRLRLQKKRLNATAALQSETFTGCDGVRTIFRFYPRPNESAEVELIFIPDGSDAIENLEQLRAFGDVLSGGGSDEVVLDGINGKPIAGKLFYARSAEAESDIEIICTGHTIDIPREDR